jgi:hypothetical protein
MLMSVKHINPNCASRASPASHAHLGCLLQILKATCEPQEYEMLGFDTQSRFPGQGRGCYNFWVVDPANFLNHAQRHSVKRACAKTKERIFLSRSKRRINHYDHFIGEKIEKLCLIQTDH